MIILFFFAVDLNTLRNILNEKSLTVFAGILLATVLFLPYIKLSESAPGFEIVDVLLPVLGIIFLAKWKQLGDRKIYFFILIFGAYIFLTMLVNSRLGQLKDYFEIVKLFKFGLIICLFSLVNGELFRKRWIPALFIILVVLNLIHYYELFGFNDLLEEYYQAGERLQRFGKNTLGFAAFKRMLGTVCNPNNNALLFSFFLSFFLADLWKKPTKKTWAFVFIATTMIFLSQSRTGLMCVAGSIGVVSVFFLEGQWKRLAGLVGITILSYTFSYGMTRLDFEVRKNDPSELMDMQEYRRLQQLSKNKGEQSTYLNTLMDGSAFGTYSMSGRLEIWKHMWDMSLEKPVFGHGPYKEYFYENGLYAESQYFSMLWRYGFLGLFAYLGFLFYLFRKGILNKAKPAGQTIALSTLVIAIGSLTNNPFDHQTILFFLAVAIGIFWSETTKTASTDSASE